jgi:molybdenum cofactor biosynthesis enzyme
MAIVNMSVHRALSELKLYANKIETTSRNAFVLANKKSNKTIGGRNVEEVSSTIKSQFDSIVALIENRKRVKDAIVNSNAVTIVTVGGKKMTVAEAIERKTAIALDRQFLAVLQNQFATQNNVVEQQNAQLPPKLESFLQATLGEKRDIEQVKQWSDTFNANNTWELIDPCHIQNYIAKLSTEIEEFASQVDYVLSESNATTLLDVDLVD